MVPKGFGEAYFSTRDRRIVFTQILLWLVLAIGINLQQNALRNASLSARYLSSLNRGWIILLRLYWNYICNLQAGWQGGRTLSLMAVFPIPLIVLCHVALSRCKLSRSSHVRTCIAIECRCSVPLAKIIDIRCENRGNWKSNTIIS